VIFKLWKRSDALDRELVGECELFVDQLNLGDGVRDEYELIKEAEVVGSLMIESKHKAATFLRPEAEVLSLEEDQEAQII